MITDRERDLALIDKMMEYCCQAEMAVERFGKSFENFENDCIFRNAVSMSLMQIGELAKRLSDEFKTRHSEIPWSSICGMRDWFAHDYNNMSIARIWSTVVDDIPVLRKFCEDILNEQ